MGLLDTIASAAGAAASSALEVLAKADASNKPSVAGGGPYPSATEGLSDELQSLMWDPFAVIDALGFKERPSPITYSMLGAMPFRMPILGTVIKTRVDQVAAFSAVQEDKFQTGFRIQQRDKKATPTKGSEKMSKELENWLLTTGVTDQPEGRDSFYTFLKKITRDSLIYDAMCAEIIYNNKGLPHSFVAVDAATIRIADTSKLHYANVKGETRYVQVYDNLVNAEFAAHEMMYGIRNPVTAITNQGYGVSEVEMLISTIVSLLWAWQYNQSYFSQGTTAKGVFNFKGAIPERQLKAFRRHWYSMVAGVENSFKTPILATDNELQYIDTQKSNSDMEFGQWFDFLIKIVCAMYNMDPMEINFKYGDTGSSNMFESSNRQKLGASKDKGLKPLLDFIAAQINTHLIHKIDPDFELKFVGLDAQTPQELADLTTKQLNAYKTIDEVRAEEDLPPLPDGSGEVVLNTVWLQAKQGAEAMAQEQAMAEQGDGEFGGDGGEDGDDDPDGGGDNPFDGPNEEKDDGSSPPNQQGGKGGKPGKPAEAAEPAELQKSLTVGGTRAPTGVLRVDINL